MFRKEAVTRAKSAISAASARPAPQRRFLPAILTLCLTISVADANPRTGEREAAADTDVTLPAAINMTMDGFKTDTLKPESSRAIDEIVVFGIRKPKVDQPKPDLFEDPLRKRVLDEIRELRLLEREFEWRSESADLNIEPPRLRFGYDPRNDARLAETSPQVLLPLDRVQPATLFSVDF